MTGEELNRIYGNVISRSAQVSVPAHWMPAVHAAMQAIHDLPTAVRAFLIVVGITDTDGELTFDVAGAVNFIGVDGMRQLRAIIEDAQQAVKIKVLH